MSPALLILLYLVGFALVLVELVTPGVIVGLLGLGCLGGAIYLTFVHHGLWSGLGASAVVALGLLAVVLYALRRLTTTEVQDPHRGYTVADPRLQELLGAEGITATPCRPSGVCTIGGRRVDVVTRGEMLEPGVRVRVIDTSGNRVVVKAI
ncbi:MAG: hypothetical protein KatS3mg102_1027 [Planctomycetota bacterium]|nr:MAG: hypothetical protein KatS3mg102_1027 [Planctomycetota bacterium]